MILYWKMIVYAGSIRRCMLAPGKHLDCGFAARSTTADKLARSAAVFAFALRRPVTILPQKALVFEAKTNRVSPMV